MTTIRCPRCGGTGREQIPATMAPSEICRLCHGKLRVSEWLVFPHWTVSMPTTTTTNRADEDFRGANQ